MRKRGKNKKFYLIQGKKVFLDQDWLKLYGSLSKATKKMKDYDKNINNLFKTIQKIMDSPKQVKRRIGFLQDKDK